jgi:hypothetical protein
MLFSRNPASNDFLGSVSIELILHLFVIDTMNLSETEMHSEYRLLDVYQRNRWALVYQHAMK